MSSRFKYSRWDGTQVGFDLDADALLEEMTDDLLYHGDLNAALRRMMQQGFRDRDGERLSGMREMLEKLRERRREQLDRYDLGGVYDDIAHQLDEIVDRSARASTGASTRPAPRATSGARSCSRTSREQRRQELEQLPPDLAGRVQRAPELRLDGRRRAPALRGADGGAAQAAPQTTFNQLSAGHVGDVARAASRA